MRSADATPSAGRTARRARVSRPCSRCSAVDDGQRADARVLHDAQRLGDAVRSAPIVCGSAMTPCCVRLTAATSRHLRRDVAGAEAAIDDADAALFGQDDGHRRARDRVHVGRDERALERDVLARTRDVQIDRRPDRASAATPSCGVSRKSSNVQPRTNSRRSSGAILPGTSLPRLGGIELRYFLSRGEGETVRAMV